MILYTGLAALFLAFTHLFVEKLKFSFVPRSKWLSFAGGISVAYVFIDLLPELAEGQEILQAKALNFLEYRTYLIALFGLLLFYGMEKTAKQSSQSEREDNNNEMPENLNVFWLHLSFLSLYNAIIGYLLITEERDSLVSLLLFAIAMAFHFIVNDYALMEHYRNAYRRKGRWIMTIAIIAGWFIGVLTEIPEMWITILFSFITGGIIMNVLKEELPDERKSNFWAFATGLVLYSALLLMV